MAVIKTLSVSIVARTKKFRKSLQRAAMAVKSFANRIKRMSIITGVVATAGLVALVKKSFDTIDALAKMADNLRIATQELVGLRRAAVLTGNSIEVIEKSLGRMTVKVGEAIDGLAESKRAFASLGLDPAKLRLLSVTEQFFAVADAINKLTNNTDKISLAYEIFGRQGIRLINTLRLGSKGLKESIEKIKQLGAAINRVDAAKVEAANDAISDMKIALTAVSDKLAVRLAPIVEASAKALTEWGKGGTRAAESIVTGLKFVGLSFARVADAVVITGNAIRLLELISFKTFTGIKGQVDKFALDIVSLLRSIPIVGERLKARLAIVEAATFIFGKTRQSQLKKLQDELKALFLRPLPSENLKKLFENIQIAAQKAGEAVAASRKKIKQFGEEIDPREAAGIKTKRTADFKQINLSRFAIGGTKTATSKPQKIESKQIDLTNKILEAINNTLIGRTFAAVLP